MTRTTVGDAAETNIRKVAAVTGAKKGAELTAGSCVREF